MHIPDGFLSFGVAIVGWILAIAAVAYALRQTRGQLGERQIRGNGSSGTKSE
jgi:ABC-type Co2+ transport system permease subunit